MGAMTQQPGAALPALTSIRFFAALTVALCHFTGLGLLGMPAHWVQWVDGGRPAVSLFFVLSGFILTITYRDTIETRGVRRFYVARVARIYPVLLLSIVLATFVTLYLLYADDGVLMHEWYALGSGAYAALGVSLLCQLLLLTAWLPFAALNQPWNGPTWSLSCEAFFYALFPLLLRKIAPRRVRTLVMSCLALWILQGVWILVVARVFPAGRSGFIISQFPISHLFEFVLGACTAIAFLALRSGARKTHGIGMLLVGASLVAIAVLAYTQPVKPAYFLESPVFDALILGLALLERPVIGLLNSRWLVRLGEASYGFYLIHVPLAHLAFIAGFRVANGWIALIFTICCSVVIFQYFEEPMRKRVKARFAQPASSSEPGLRDIAPRVPS